MKTSESQTKLIDALLKARMTFPTITKDKQGQSGNRTFKYAPLEVIKDACDPILFENGLMVSQGTMGHDLVTRLEHVSGEWREISMPVNEAHANPQSYGIEITYKRRYSYQLILNIVTEEDTDGDGFQGAKARKTRGPGVIKPTDGALESLPQDQQEYMKELAMDAAEAFKRFGDAAAFDRVEREHLENDQKVALWSLLDSKTRAGLKREAERRNN